MPSRERRSSSEPKYLEAAEANLAFLRRELWDAETKTLHHRWRDGQRDDVQLLDAYAFLLDGVLHLYEATLEPQHLQFAIDLTGAMKTRFTTRPTAVFGRAPTRRISSCR